MTENWHRDLHSEFMPLFITPDHDNFKHLFTKRPSIICTRAIKCNLTFRTIFVSASAFFGFENFVARFDRKENLEM